MENGPGFSGTRVKLGTLAAIRGSNTDGAMCWAAGGTDTDGDPGSDERVVQGVRALHHCTALGRIAQTERGGRATHLEHMTEGRNMEQAFTHETCREYTCYS